MKIYLVTMGSRGDHEPFRALAYEAASRGHEVHFAHTSDLPRDANAPYTEWDLPGSLEQLISDQGVSVWRAIRDYSRIWQPTLQAIFDQSTSQILSLKPDLVVYHPEVQSAPVIAHEVGATAVIAEMVPMLTPTSEFAAAGIPLDLGATLNRASYRLVDLGIAAVGNPAQKLAKKRGVSRWTPDLALCPVSPTLVPPPRDWPATASITGQWFMDSSGALDDETAAFIADGNIVYTGFGSMKRGDPTTRARVIVDAARGVGMKTVLVTGWGGLAPDSELASADDVLVRESVNHKLLLPRMSLAIHHGGSGTTHAMLRAGVPSVIMPFIGDQPWWAWRLHQQGLGPRPVPTTVSTASKLQAAMTEALGYRDAAAEAATAMRKENGVELAMTIIESAG